ncbi:MAG TPA: hypothetical protein VIZ90_16890 [Rhizobiaceae bacterium]
MLGSLRKMCGSVREAGGWQSVLAASLVAGLLASIAATPANAGGSSIGVSVTSERLPDDFNSLKSTDFEVDASHTFDNHVIIGASLKYYDTAHSGDSTLNIEGTIGYVHSFTDFISLTASVGVGERFQTSGQGNDFPYYVARLGADVVVTPTITWNAISLRYRNAFDTDNDYDTPEVATGVTFKLDERHSVSAQIERDWKDGEASYTGLQLGYRFHF